MKSYYIDIHTHHRRTDIVTPSQCGVHPWDAETEDASCDLSQCDMVGEIGLDYACGVSREAQTRMFRTQLAEAERLQKPVVLHVVRSFEDVMRILDDYTLRGVVFHGFIGSTQQAVRCFDRGYYLSFGERSLRSPKSCNVVKSMPHEWLFCETDDKPDTPIEEIYRRVAELRHASVEELRQQIATNYEKLICL